MSDNLSKKNHKVILIFFPPIFNSFNFISDENNRFLDLPNVLNNFDWQNRKDIISWAQKNYSNNYSEQLITQFSSENLKDNSRSIILNCPRNKEQMQLFNNFLQEKVKKITVIILKENSLNLLELLDKKFIICPICEAIYKKTENDSFTCPKDKLNFSQKEIEEFTRFYMDYYLENIVPLIKFFSENFVNNNSRATPFFEIIPLTVTSKEELFERTPAQILKMINEISSS